MSKSHTYNIATGLVVILTAACMASSAYAAAPLPTGGTIVGGNAVGEIKTVGNTTTVKQYQERMIAKWDSFDIAENYGVEFKQPNSTSVALNRIGSANAAQIYGSLKANGTIILMSQNGIHFGPNAQVNVGSLVATTSKMSDADFWDAPAKKMYIFAKGSNANAEIINEGHITVADRGLVTLVAPTVKNSGVITAKLGKVQMASGDSSTVSVDLYGDGLLSLQASGDVKKQLIENSGTISANGGDVLMTADVANTVVDSLINMNGVIEAKTIGIKEGQVTLEADIVNVGAGAQILATGLNAGEKGGEIEIDATRNVTIGTSAHMIAAGTMEGGEIDVDAGKDIVINKDALLCAKSAVPNKGGDIKLDGGSVTMNPGSRLNTTGGELKLSGTNPSSTAKNGVTLNGAKLTAGSGKISIEGKGTDKATTDYNNGVYIFGGSRLETTGIGSIDIKGTGGAGTGTDFNTGVFVTGNNTTIQTEGGNLTVNGFGGSNGGGNDSSSYAIGIFVNDNALITSDSGKISLTGIAGGGCNCTTNDWGVAIRTASKVKTNIGDIVIFGKGGDAGVANTTSTFTDNYGVLVSSKSEITSASGKIDITGVGGGDQSAARRNYGIYVKGEALIGTPAKTPLDMGTIRFKADTLEMDNSVKINTTNTVFFEPYTDSTTIGVAGADGTLQIDNIVLGDIENAGHITIGNTDRDTGLLTANAYTWQADVSLLNKDGNIDIDGSQDAQGHTFLAETVNGDITINEHGGVVGVGSGTPIVLAASKGSFKNYSGADALSAPNGRWLVYSGGPMTNRYDGLTADFHRYSCTYGGVCTPTIPASGNGFVYSVTPVLTVAANDEHITYGDDAPAYTRKSATEKYTFKGVEYNLIGTAFSDIGDVSLTSTYVKGADKGTYPINPIDANAATVGYTFNPIAGTLTVDAATLNVIADNQRMTYGGTVPTLTYTSSGLIGSDTLSGALALGSGSLNAGTRSITQGSLSAGSNYVISFTNGTLTIDPAKLYVRADNKSMILGGLTPALTYTYSGFVNGDTASLFTGGLAVGAPATATTYPIEQGNLSAGSNYSIVYTPGVLTVAGVDPHNVLERWKNLGKRGPNGVLLAIVNTNEASMGNLADLAPAAGGDNPQRLADLAPKAGGNTGITPLVQCDLNTPCDINQ